jgi:hypothetical protein
MQNEPKNGTMLQNEPKLYNYIDVFCVKTMGNIRPTGVMKWELHGKTLYV